MNNIKDIDWYSLATDPNDKETVTNVLGTGLDINMLENLYLWFAEYKPTSSSATDVFNDLKGDKMLMALKFVSLLGARSKLHYGTAKENRDFCALVPLFMAAQKRYNDIPYEFWDKSDINYGNLMGLKLFGEISPYRGMEFDANFITLARTQALEYKGRRLAVTEWPRHQIIVQVGDTIEKWKSTKLFRHILLQTWVANVELRSDLMILDVNNLDNMPDSLDATVETTAELSPVW